jgi:hypothetical protein
MDERGFWGFAAALESSGLVKNRLSTMKKSGIVDLELTACMAS